jgi:hypothetical protein
MRRLALFLSTLYAWLSVAIAGAAQPTKAPIETSMDLGAKCCLAWLNPEKDFLPTGGYEVAHDTGRWWDAMLRYEAASGVRTPAQAEAAMMANLRRLTDNPAALLASGKCNPHNFRETLLTYAALVLYRKSAWADAQGRKLVRTMAELLEPDGQMDYERLAQLIGQPLTTDKLMMLRFPQGQWFNAVGSTGRALEGLVVFHVATGDAEALKLAGRLAEIHLRNSIDPSGQIRPELLAADCISHTHSYCGTLRGLLLYGLATGDRRFIDAVANTYRKGLWGKAISYSGWTPHDQGKTRFANKEGEPIGEHASCGDVAQLALWLALRDGQTDLLDDVERLVRARILPSQISDATRPRNDGAWGVYSHPFGKASILDVFAAVVHSLADIHENIVTTTPDGTLSVNLHFDINTPAISIRSQRAKEATLEITLKETRALRIRVPGWATRSSVRLAADGKDLPLTWDGHYLVVAKGTGQIIQLRHDLPEKQTTEEMPVSHRQFHLSWRGDEVITCDPPVPIYPAQAR